jgi:hypothetical protein
MTITRAQQAALYYARRRRRLALSVLNTLTPWSEGLEVSQGQYVSCGGSPYIASHDGTTGPNAPTGHTSTDSPSGGVTWVRADIQSLLQFLYKGAPTP